MNALLVVVQPGIGTTVQDAGRLGQRQQGIPSAGWLDAPLAQASNALLGNALDDAVLELRGMGTVLRVQVGPVRVALAGHVDATILRADGHRRALPPWQSDMLRPGDQLLLGVSHSGCAYLAVSGGLQLPRQLGSRSSDRRAGLAGLMGRVWLAGDELPCGRCTPAEPGEWRCAPWELTPGPLRVILGPQDDHFTPEAVALFLNTHWEATAAQDRMGLRLQGPALAHAVPSAAEIVSDAVVPGAVQVPANGQPIVLLADGQTVGGYPKIATVIRADLPRLAHLTPGTAIRFEAVDHAQAREALRQELDRWQRWLGTRTPFSPPGSVDESALQAANLISGMIATQPDEDRP